MKINMFLLLLLAPCMLYGSSQSSAPLTFSDSVSHDDGGGTVEKRKRTVSERNPLNEIGTLEKRTKKTEELIEELKSQKQLVQKAKKHTSATKVNGGDRSMSSDEKSRLLAGYRAHEKALRSQSEALKMENQHLRRENEQWSVQASYSNQLNWFYYNGWLNSQNQIVALTEQSVVLKQKINEHELGM